MAGLTSIVAEMSVAKDSSAHRRSSSKSKTRVSGNNIVVSSEEPQWTSMAVRTSTGEPQTSSAGVKRFSIGINGNPLAEIPLPTPQETGPAQPRQRSSVASVAQEAVLKARRSSVSQETFRRSSVSGSRATSFNLGSLLSGAAAAARSSLVQQSRRSSSTVSHKCKAKFFGDHLLIPQDEMDLMCHLDAFRYFSQVTVTQIPTVDGGATLLFVSPKDAGNEPMLPSIVKICNVELIRSELQKVQGAIKAFKQAMLRPIDFSPHLEYMPIGAKGALQLELIGSTCCLPWFAENSVSITDAGVLFERAVTCEDEVERSRLQSQFFIVQQTLFGEIMLRSNFVRKATETLDLGERYNVRKVLSAFLAARNEFSARDGPLPKDRAMQKDRSASKERGEHKEFVMQELLAPHDEHNHVEQILGELTGCPKKLNRSLRDFVNPLATFKVQCCMGKVHGSLDMGNVLQDGEGRAFVGNVSTFEENGHVFADICRWMVSGLFAHAPMEKEGGEEEEAMKELVKHVASIPSIDASLPETNEQLPDSIIFVWAFARRMFGFLQDYVAQTRRSPKEKSDEKDAVKLRMDHPEQQFIWMMLYQSICLLAQDWKILSPKRKQITLYGITAFAVRLRDIQDTTHTDYGKQLPWVATYGGYWFKGFRPADGRVRILSVSARVKNAMGRWGKKSRLSLCQRKYLTQVANIEAWVPDPFTRLKFSVLNETVNIELRDKKDEDIEGYRAVCDLLQEHGRLLIVGPAGSGKTIATRQLVAYTAEHQMTAPFKSSLSRLPLRVPLVDLARIAAAGVSIEPGFTRSREATSEKYALASLELVSRHMPQVLRLIGKGEICKLADGWRIGKTGTVFRDQAGDDKELKSKDLDGIYVRYESRLFDEFMELRLSPEEREALESTRSQGWLLCLDGVDEAVGQKSSLLFWLNNLLDTEPQHQILMTTRPSAVEVDRETEVGASKVKAVLTWQWLNDLGFQVLDVKLWEQEQLRRLCECRLRGCDAADREKVLASLLTPKHEILTRSPLLATMVMHFVQTCLAEKKQASLSRAGIYEFAFKEMLHRFDSLRRRGASTNQQMEVSAAQLETVIMRLCHDKQRCQSRDIQKN